MPKISVLIPAYNVGPYIRECLDSVLNQTMQDFEIICVDDCSTDDTYDIIKCYADRDEKNRIKIIRHDVNKGQASGRNDALVQATGEYVYMLDADDMIVPEALEELYDICSRNQLDIIGFETKNFAEEDRFQANVNIKTITYQDTDVMDGRKALVYCMENESFSLSTPTFMMRREYLIEENIRFVEGILHEDVGYILELITRAERVRFLHKVYFLRRIRSNSTMTVGFTAKNIEGYIKSFYKSFEIEADMKKYLDTDSSFEAAFRKWQRDIFGRMNQLYSGSAETIEDESGGHVDEEIRRVFESIKLGHFRTEKLGISECYLCGTGQYTERAIQAVAAQDIIIKGIIVLEKKRKSFGGFPLVLAEEAEINVPVVVSVSKYSKGEYMEALGRHGLNKIIELSF
jgi:glycosyltransferase involved in cell wall biosynthesis